MIAPRSRAGKLIRRGFLLEYITLLWNVAGGPILLFAGSKADSAGLVGFGFDSLIEIFASVIVIWHLKGEGRAREAVALRCIGTAFCILAVVVLWQSIHGFLSRHQASQSWLGTTWLSATVLVMLLLALGKAVTGRALDNAVLQAEARVTFTDAALSAVVLLSVFANDSWDLWWADPAAGMVIVLYALREARNGLCQPKPHTLQVANE